ncbi:hypothetical protein A1OK_18735 [Enterovibrio norvegicus FF-454]|uniref:eCIS core domain-containing protein n=1 Tax=Enterovibrio norvegicus FF-454 TaxID=1185651 RepID=A0A1E5CEB4_9GAMM|nr:DUF4157 domain-containing protein [Enterovibrio norvegicus]OEE63846.1 hypothetical protein A1OK_18735 [Enterovibrio norvegicus FF-454]
MFSFAQKEPTAMRPDVGFSLASRLNQRVSIGGKSKQCACNTPAHEDKTDHPLSIKNADAAEPIKIQMMSKDSLSSDGAEREADDVANQVMNKPASSPSGNSCSACQKRGSATPSSLGKALPLSRPSIPSHLQSRVPGAGEPLSVHVRQDMEQRFGYDFSNVRVHNDAKAADSASSLRARAYTLGNNIIFNRGQYQPHSVSGQKVLAHELTHVLQQSKAGRSATQFLSEADCANECSKKDGNTTETGKFSITVFADKEGPFLLLPATHKVGHSWIRLQDDKGNLWTYGFWPKEGFDADDTRADVDGCVHHPDKTQHNKNNPTRQTFELTAEQFNAAYKFAVKTCNDRPKYNLFGLQCTEFVKQALAAAGQGSAGGFGLIWESPNALASWMKTNALVLGINTTGATSAADQAGQGAVGLDLKYRHQFYSLLGTKLRLYGMGRAEISSPVKAGSVGFGLELNTQKVWLPELYLETGATIGDLNPTAGQDKFGAGVMGSAGLRFSIDELAFVGVEYNLVKDLVNNDPELHRLMFSVGIRLF